MSLCIKHILNNPDKELQEDIQAQIKSLQMVKDTVLSVPDPEKIMCPIPCGRIARFLIWFSNLFTSQQASE